MDIVIFAYEKAPPPPPVPANSDARAPLAAA